MSDRYINKPPLPDWIWNHHQENGRTYHAFHHDLFYWLPNDESAPELIDITHHLYLLTFNRQLHYAPISPRPDHILDIGTGTAAWAIDMADQYPNTSVLAVDLSPVQPINAPLNCFFHIADDVTQDWAYNANYFDFVHIRDMYGAIPDWQQFLDRAFKHTRPGGWVEVVEHSVEPDALGGLPQHHLYRKWGELVTGLGDRRGHSFREWRNIKPLRGGCRDMLMYDGSAAYLEGRVVIGRKPIPTCSPPGPAKQKSDAGETSQLNVSDEGEKPKFKVPDIEGRLERCHWTRSVEAESEDIFFKLEDLKVECEKRETTRKDVKIACEDVEASDDGLRTKCESKRDSGLAF